MIIDLSQYEINKDDYDKIKILKKKNIHSNIIGHIFTDKINELYNLDQTKNEWIIQYDDLLLILDYYLHEDKTIGIEKKIIRIRSSNLNKFKKISELLSLKTVNNMFI